jgi:rhombotail lipoprotein
MTIPTRSTALAIAMLGLTLALPACTTLHEQHTSTSVVDFLYPNAPQTRTPDRPVTQVPTLNLPLRLGIAFVPATGSGAPALTEPRRMALMQQVADRFKPLPYIKGIELLPSNYLKPHGGFDNLDQLRALYGVDVIALVSYDQVQFTDEGALSLTYWTIVGAYVVPAERNETQTLLDTVVVDVGSRSILFRAPGTAHVTGRATLVNSSEQLRADSNASFDAAANRMIENLDAELGRFKEALEKHPERFAVVRPAS